MEEVRDGERLPLTLKELGKCEVFPQSLTHSPNGRFVSVCGDGEYIIYTALAWRNRDMSRKWGLSTITVNMLPHPPDTSCTWTWVGCKGLARSLVVKASSVTGPDSVAMPMRCGMLRYPVVLVVAGIMPGWQVVILIIL